MNWMIRFFIVLIACCLMSATHYGPEYDRAPRYALDAFAEALAKECELEFLNSGLGSLADGKEGVWAINLISRKEVTLEEGRVMAKMIAEKLLEKVFADPLFAQWCQHQENTFRGSELKKEYVAFRLAFWDKNNDRPQYPFLAQIRLADCYFYYHYADPITQSLQPPIIEPLP